ncbi:MAG: AsmA family protein, partial [Aquabacterium sp.]|nr:AsmA family protein [Aquabacterium sp.]
GAGGQVKGALRIDSGADPLAIRVNASFNRLKLDQLLPRVGESQAAIGAITGKVQLAGRGNSYAQMLAGADGDAQLAMGRGRISNLLLELAGLDAAEALKFWVGGDRESDVRCALIDTQVERGLMRARTAIFDTSDTLVRLEGTVNLRDEALDLTVKPAPKDPSPLSLRVPIHVRGTLADPSVIPDRTGLLLRGGGAVLLGLVTPWAAWLPLIETGPGEDSDCGALLKRASEEGVKAVNATPASSAADSSKSSGKAAAKGATNDPASAPRR